MYRGTTPKISIKVNGIDVQSLEKLYVTFSQNGVLFEKTTPDITVNGQTLEMTLTQAETLSLAGDTSVKIQLRALGKDGSAVAGNIVKVYVADILKDGVIT